MRASFLSFRNVDIFIKAQESRTDVSIVHIKSVCNDLSSLSSFEKDTAYQLVGDKVDSMIQRTVSDYERWYANPALFIVSFVMGTGTFILTELTSFGTFAAFNTISFLGWSRFRRNVLREAVGEAYGKQRAFNFVKTNLSVDEITKMAITKNKD
jgi:hypothetical protein